MKIIEILTESDLHALDRFPVKEGAKLHGEPDITVNVPGVLSTLLF